MFTVDGWLCSVQSATDKSREDLSFLSADGSSLGHTTSSGVERMRLDLEKKTRDELIELVEHMYKKCSVL